MPTITDWEPLAPPASPSAADDEFADASGGVPGGWTEFDFGNVAAIGEDRQGLTITIGASAAVDHAGVYKAILAGDGTWWTRIAIGAPRASTSRIGIALLQDATLSSGDLAFFFLRTNSTDQAVVYATLTAYNATPSVVTSHSISTDASVTHLWLRVRRTGTTYAMEWSTDGIGWSLLRSGTLAITPAQIGIVMDAAGLSETSVGRASFWRYVGSDVGLTGLASGDQITYDVRVSGATTLGELTAAVAAHVPEIASGDVFLEELYGGGTDIAIAAAGAVDLGELVASAAAIHALEAAGVVDLAELTVSGAAIHGQLITGNSFLPQLVAEGTAGREVLASGAVILGELTASGTQGVVGAAALGGLTAAGSALVSSPPIGGDTEPPASGSGGVGGNAGAGGADVCLDVDLGIEDAVTGIVTLLPQPVQLRLKARRRMISRTPSGYARATTLPGREAVIQWGEAFLGVADMATLRAAFAGRVNIMVWREPDGTPIRMRTRRDSFKTRWSWAQPGFYDPLVLTLTEMP